MTPLEAAARELVKYKTIAEFHETEWSECVNPARAAISAFLRAAANDTAAITAMSRAIADVEVPHLESALASAYIGHFLTVARAVLAALEPNQP